MNTARVTLRQKAEPRGGSGSPDVDCAHGRTRDASPRDPLQPVCPARPRRLTVVSDGLRLAALLFLPAGRPARGPAGLPRGGQLQGEPPAHGRTGGGGRTRRAAPRLPRPRRERGRHGPGCPARRAGRGRRVAARLGRAVARRPRHQHGRLAGFCSPRRAGRTPSARSPCSAPRTAPPCSRVSTGSSRSLHPPRRSPARRPASTCPRCARISSCSTWRKRREACRACCSRTPGTTTSCPSPTASVSRPSSRRPPASSRLMRVAITVRAVRRRWRRRRSPGLCGTGRGRQDR